MAPTQSITSCDSVMQGGVESLREHVSESLWNTSEKCMPDSFYSSSCRGMQHYSSLKDLVGGVDDYGLYWDSNFEDEADDALGSNVSQRSSSITSISSLESEKYLTDEDGMSTPDTCASSSNSSMSEEEIPNTVFLYNNNLAPVSCRSFESPTVSRSDRVEQVCLSISGFRIVQDFGGERAEFKVVLVLDFMEYIGWKSFADFEELAQACREFSCPHEVPSWLSFFQPSTMTRRSPSSIDLRESILAWERVLDLKLWSWLQRSLSIQRLMEEAGALEIFLRQILYEIPSPTILVEFVAA